MRLFLVRHGRTQWNKEEIFRGRADIPLDEVGRKEAERVADRLQGEDIGLVLSSPLSRAREMAEVIAKGCGAPLEVREGLIDLDFGEWQGLSHQEVKERYPELYRRWKERPHEVIFPGGEDLEEVKRRALGVIEEVRGQGHGVVIVTHRVVLKVLICALLGLDNSHFWHILQDTAAINCFRFDGKRWILHYLNDTCHLLPLKGREGGKDF